MVFNHSIYRYITCLFALLIITLHFALEYPKFGRQSLDATPFAALPRWYCWLSKSFTCSARSTFVSGKELLSARLSPAVLLGTSRQRSDTSRVLAAAQSMHACLSMHAFLVHLSLLAVNLVSVLQ